ncbi:MAG: adenylate/guanylate cyclase domain-containing protein [Deltaproteobacteria bacterium]
MTFDLIIEGPEVRQRQRAPLAAERAYVLGRDLRADIAVPWDPHISRRHAELKAAGRKLRVRKLAGASTPLFYAGREVDSAELAPGEHFVLGHTCFVLFARPSSEPSPHRPRAVEEVAFTREALEQVQYRDPDRRIEVLSHLPEVIWGARSDADLNIRLVNLLLAGIAQADAAGLVEVGPEEAVSVLHWDRRRETAGAFRPSKRLVVESLLRRRQSVLNMWENSEREAEFTATQEFDWAFCTPISGPPGESRGLYLGGRFDLAAAQPGRLLRDAEHLQGDVKFAELVAEIVGSVRKLNHLERQQAGLRQFLPPAVLSAIGSESDPTLLAPRESNVTVMFCDLRGFSRQAETARNDLAGLLDRVSQALGVMTRHISAHGGVIGDFQGDAAMGFWGWPVAADDDPLKACRAALAIRAEFAAAARTPAHPLADFRMGIGLARGKAVAGRIGTGEHFVFTAFGPVVNLASRLEGMTKQLHVPIVIDEAMAGIVRERLPAEEGRLRSLAKVLPYGMETPAVVSELLPGERDLPELRNADLAAYDAAVAHFIAGRWEEAYTALRALPPGDRAQDFLAGHIVSHNRLPPPDWTGVVKLPSK